MNVRLLLSCWTTVAVLVAQTDGPGLTHGPFRGHVDSTAMHVWARARAAGTFNLALTSVVDGAVTTAVATADPAHDLVLHFAATGLAPGTAYTARITTGETELWAGATWTTAPRDDAAAATIAFGSCAHDTKVPQQPIWGQLLARAPQALVLLGDTPYIDLGTVAARRQRHRDFFAVPAIAAALQALPTWTTWDDHDYALNDQFGAVAGSDTARPVFVDYHAHAGYGDGTTGIWTSFRRGPIEVFLLDARSCADSGDSPLAPGERTLLGSAQLAWLQRGLTTSTAPLKVLASGMVWNGGVRPGKKDHWGHWAAERDALFRWLGAQRIDGVVLVSGDVHRSRVILHPTRDLVGYDVPEFVTSPLAQDVIETNAVPVPGLVFDAGEPSSALLLAANAADGGTVVHATFVAGDGREFHRRELAGGALVRPDAAASYRRIAGLLRQQFGTDLERVPEAGSGGAAGEPDEALATGPEWRAAVAAAAPVVSAWRTAAAETRCRLRGTTAEPLQREVVELLRTFTTMQRLAVARTRQAVAGGDAAAASESIALLAAVARHLQQDPCAIAWGLAIAAERDAAALQVAFAARHGAAAGSSGQAITQHLAGRPDIAALGVALRAEVWQLFDESIGQLGLGADRRAQVARTQLTALRRHFGQRIDALFAPLDRATDGDAEAVAATCRALGEALQREARERRAALRELEAAGALPADAAADLALQLATLLTPDVASLVREHAAARAALAAAAR